MKVYAISHGDYSDYRIVAMFTNNEAAEAAIASMKGMSGYYGDEHIEEWDAFDTVPRKVRLYVKECNAGTVREFDNLYNGWDDPIHTFVGRVSRGLGFGKYGAGDRNYRYWGLDKARVHKAFDDYHAQRQAEAAGVG